MRHYLFGDGVIWVRRHASGHVEDDLHVGGSVVRRCGSCAAIPLQTTHKPTVRRQIHLKEREAFWCSHRTWSLLTTDALSEFYVFFHLPSQPRDEVLIRLTTLCVGQNGAFVLLAFSNVEDSDLVRLSTGDRKTQDEQTSCKKLWHHDIWGVTIFDVFSVFNHRRSREMGSTWATFQVL